MAKAGRPKLEKNMTAVEKDERFWDSMGAERQHSILAVLATGSTIIGKAQQFESPTVEDMAELGAAMSFMAQSFGLED